MGLARRTLLGAAGAGLVLSGCTKNSDAPSPSASSSAPKLDKLPDGFETTPSWSTAEFGWMGGPVVQTHGRLWFIATQKVYVDGATPAPGGDWPCWIVGVDLANPGKPIVSEKLPHSEGTSRDLVTIDQSKNLYAWQHDAEEFMVVQLSASGVKEVWRGKPPREGFILQAGNNPIAMSMHPDQGATLVGSSWKQVTGHGQLIGANAAAGQTAWLGRDSSLWIDRKKVAALSLGDEIGPLWATCPAGIYVMDAAVLKEYFHTWKGQVRPVTRSKDLAPAAAMTWGNTAFSPSGRFVYGTGGALDQETLTIHSTLQLDGAVGSADAVVWVDESDSKSAVLHRMDHDSGLMRLEKLTAGQPERLATAEGIRPFLGATTDKGGRTLGLFGGSVLAGAAWDAGIGVPLAICQRPA